MIRKNLLRVVFSLTTAGAAVVALQMPAAAVTQGPFYFWGWESGRCIDDPHSNPNDNIVQEIWNCIDGGTNQHWWTIDTDSRYFMIKNVSSQKCLTVKNASTQNNYPILQFTCNNGDNQQWRPEYYINDGFGHNYYQLRNRKSGLCLTVKNASIDNGATLLQFTCSPVQGNNVWTWSYSL